MATREASIRVTMRRGSFNQQLRGMTSQVRTAGARMGSALSGPMSAGLGAARKSMGGLFRSLKSSVGMALRLGGALSAGILIKGAADLQSKYRDIAFSLEKIPGPVTTWQQVQALIEKAVDNTGRGADELADAFHEVFKATGNFKFSAAVIANIGTLSTASGAKVESLGNAAQIMSRKFGMGIDDINEGFAALSGLTGAGGKDIDKMSGRFAAMAGEAAEAGFVGTEGFKKLLGTLISLDSVIGEKADTGLKLMFQTLKEGSSLFIKFEKDAKFKFDPDMSMMEKIRKTLTTVEGRAAAELNFTADARTVYDTLAAPFDAALEEAKTKGLSKAEAMDAALAAFDESIKKSTKTTKMWSQIQKDATDRMKDDPSVLLRRATEKIQAAFMQPEMVAALETVAKKLPVFAKKLAELIDWIAGNPLKAIAAVGGLKVGGAFAGGMMGNLGAQLLPGLKSAFGIGGKVATGAATTAATTTTAAATTAAGITKAGALAAKATAVAGAAAIGYALGNAIHEHLLGPQSEKTAKASDKYENVIRKAEEVQRSGTATIEEKMAAAKAVQAAKQPSIVSAENVAGAFSSVFTGEESPLEKRERISDRAAKAHEALTKSIEQQAYAEYNRKQATVEAVQGLRRFKRAITDAIPPQAEVTGGPRGTSHLENAPGSEPKGG